MSAHRLALTNGIGQRRPLRRGMLLTVPASLSSPAPSMLDRERSARLDRVRACSAKSRAGLDRWTLDRRGPHEVDGARGETLAIIADSNAVAVDGHRALESPDQHAPQARRAPAPPQRQQRRDAVRPKTAPRSRTSICRRSATTARTGTARTTPVPSLAPWSCSPARRSARSRRRHGTTIERAQAPERARARRRCASGQPLEVSRRAEACAAEVAA